MKIKITKKFYKDVSKIQDNKILEKIEKVIDFMKFADTFAEISDNLKLKKIVSYDNFYRIRIGDYRLGIEFSNDTIILKRFMNRKDIYKYFP